MNSHRLGVAALICLAAMPAFANSWTGYLVDAGCYAAEERSVNPSFATNHAYRDTDMEIKSCTPSAKTKKFAVVVHSGYGFKLDPVGNAKAAEIIQQTGRKHPVQVVVTGEKSKDSIEVGSISPAN